MPSDEDSYVSHALYIMPALPDQSSLDPVTPNQSLADSPPHAPEPAHIIALPTWAPLCLIVVLAPWGQALVHVPGC